MNHRTLRCPRHTGATLKDGGEPGLLTCDACRREFRRVYRVWDFAPPSAAEPFLDESRQWDAQASHYERGRVSDSQYMAGIHAAVRGLGETKNSDVLDAGCGTGITSRLLAPACRSLTCLDASAESLRLLARPAGMANVVTVRGDVMALPFADGSFDAVLCANVLQQIPGGENRLRAVAELARVTRAGGRVVISAHAWSARKRRLGWGKEGPAGGSSGPVRYVCRFSADEFRQLLDSALKVERVTGAAFPLPYRFKLSPLSRVLEGILRGTPAAAAWGEMLVGRCVRR